MADSLRRLTNIGSFSTLQEKLERWLDLYHINTADQNLDRCSEIMELTCRIQSQLSKLSATIAAEGGIPARSLSTRTRLWPHWWPYEGYSHWGWPYYEAALESARATVAAKERELHDVQLDYDRNVRTLEDDLKITETENASLQQQLADSRVELDDIQRASTSDKMFSQSEQADLRHRLSLADSEIDRLRRRYSELQDEFYFATGHRARSVYVPDYVPLCCHDDCLATCCHSDLHSTRCSARALSRPGSPLLVVEDSLLRARQTDPVLDGIIEHEHHKLFPSQETTISRFNDLFTIDRLDAMRTLRIYSVDHENNQRIVFHAVKESFSIAKISFHDHKNRVRSQLAITHLGPGTLEDAVFDHLRLNPDPQDMPALLQDVVAALNRNPRLYLPAHVSYHVIGGFLRECIRLAWLMQTLRIPLDIAFAADGELFDQYKYRRSFDSDFMAPLVSYHVWPCLMQGSRVVVKGEACTKRGASLTAGSTSRRRSVSPPPARSPRRGVSGSRPGSRARSKSR